MRALVMLSLLSLSCYASGGDEVDAPAPAPCQGLRLVNEAQVEWPSVDCGGFTHPRVTAVSGGEGPFQTLVTEYRRPSCDDRNPQLLTRRIGVEEGRLVLGEEVAIGDATAVGSLASNGSQYAVCSGTRLYTNTDLITELQPACSLEASCAGLAHDGDGWAVGWAPGCDAPGQLMRRGPGGGPRDAESAEMMAGVISMASSADGFGALIGGDSLTLFDWPSGASVPTPFPLERARFFGLAALSAWPFAAGAWAVFTVQGESLRMRVVSATGDVLVDEGFETELPGHESHAVRVASSAAGVAVVVSYNSTDGRFSPASRLLVFGAEGALVGQELDVDPESANVLPVTDVAMSGASVLMHREGAFGTTDLVLYDCE